jgi:O-antigen ligase
MSSVLTRVESLLFSPIPRRARSARAGLIVVGALLAASLVAVAGPVLALAIVVVLAGAVLVLRDLRWGFVVLFAVIGLLPFATLPFKLGFTPTFLDLALLALYFVWVVRIARREQHELIGSVLGIPVLIFLLLAIFAFVVGIQYALPTSTTTRNFVELVLGILAFFLVLNSLGRQADIELVACLIMLAGAMGATIAIVLYFVPQDWTIRVFDSLSRFNYPGGAGALRYINDDPSQAMRAIGTQIDPNVLGGFLILMAGFTAPQLVSARPLVPRAWVAFFLAAEALALYLTHSRGSLVGLAAAISVLGALRYRRLLLLELLALVALILLPQAQAYVAHFIAGIQLQDQATQMRLGEYKDALTLIMRYPWFGVGFAGSPDASLYIGVSSVYLLMAEEMGIIGVICYLVIVAGFFGSLWHAWRRCRADIRVDKAARREALLLGTGTGILAVMVGGLFDHYLFNLVYPHMSTLFWIFLGLGMAATLPRSATN